MTLPVGAHVRLLDYASQQERAGLVGCTGKVLLVGRTKAAVALADGLCTWPIVALEVLTE